MNIFSNKKIYLFLTIFISALIVSSFYYFNYVSEKKFNMQKENYEQQAENMKARVAQMIYEKQKATIAIGLVLVQDKSFAQKLKHRTIDDRFYKELVSRLRQETEYKNIWVNIVDNKLNSVYRSWIDKRGDNLKYVRSDMVEVLKTKKVKYTLSSGKFTVAIKALIPVMENGRVVGILELISHFNSIALTLEKFHIDSVVVLNKEYTQNLQHPFTKKFIDGHYIANFAAPQDKLEYLQKKGIENYFLPGYKIENGYIITNYPLITFNGKNLGYYIMFKPLTQVSSADEDFFVFKWVAIGFIIILILTAIVNVILFYIAAKQKEYVKKIIDTSTNIVIINNKQQMLDVNKTFFKYFSKENSMEEFREKYQCICELFVNGDGYVSKRMGNEYWIDYIINNKDKINKVKIIYDNKVYFFAVGVSLISSEKGYYSTILSDVTKEEMYKLELEKLTVTDVLTGIGNRRYYNIKIEENISLAKRYKFSLSIIMIDIDHFKKVNDQHGHGVGDNVLVEYSKLITTIIREADIFCRLGGEEFIIIVPYADCMQAEKLAEKIRKRVEESKVILPITMSFGVTEYTQGEDSDHLLSRADSALYDAKENGRNQVVCK